MPWDRLKSLILRRGNSIDYDSKWGNWVPIGHVGKFWGKVLPLVKPKQNNKHQTPIHICWSPNGHKHRMETGSPQMRIFHLPPHFHMGSPHLETRTVFFAIHSVTQIWYVTKKFGRETDTFPLLPVLGAVEAYHCRQKFSNKAEACT